MSNFPQDREPAYGEGPPGAGYSDDPGTPREGAPFQSGASAGAPPMAGPQYGGSQYAGGPSHHQQTQQFGGYGGAASYQGGSGRRMPQIRSTFKTTEFWIFVVVALGVLIAAAVTDELPDGQRFSAYDAWRLVTFLAIGYMISRGFTKFRGHEHDCGRHESDRGRD